MEKFTDAQLRDELERRQKASIEAGKPLQLPSPDLTALCDTCQKYIDDLAAGNPVDEDYDHWVFEDAMKALYGSGVFEWINQRR